MGVFAARDGLRLLLLDYLFSTGPDRTMSLMHAEDTSRGRSTRQSIMAYLVGEQSLDLVLEVIESGGDGDSLRQFVRDLSGYGDPKRLDLLLARLEAA